MQSDRLKLLRSEDGSITLWSPQYSDTYHSINGAIQESQHIFIQNGLDLLANEQAKEIVIFEMGFGTGLNALLTMLEAERRAINIIYISLEKHPLGAEYYSQIDYYNQLDCQPEQYMFLHTAPINQVCRLSNYFQLIKLEDDLTKYSHSHQYDLVYFDAFAPSSQPELWTEQVFTPIINAMKKHAILVTYCSKGSFKRTLKSVGFKIESPPGPKGKREMTRAIKGW